MIDQWAQKVEMFWYLAVFHDALWDQGARDVHLMNHWCRHGFFHSLKQKQNIPSLIKTGPFSPSPWNPPSMITSTYNLCKYLSEPPFELILFILPFCYRDGKEDGSFCTTTENWAIRWTSTWVHRYISHSSILDRKWEKIKTASGAILVTLQSTKWIFYRVLYAMK